MKVTTNVEQEICDFCKTNETYTWNACLGCGKAICYDCSKTHAREYTHGVYFSGSGDGKYCLPCDTERRQSMNDPLHAAYLVIENLRAECKAWNDDFGRRKKDAEAKLEALPRPAK